MSSFEGKENHIPMQKVMDNVTKMAYDPKANQIARSQSLAINTVNYEDCARNKFSVWGPCISDMTLQVNNQRMPVIREPNYTDTTWDVEMDKIPLIVGNHDSNPGSQLSTVSLRKYLENFADYMSTPPKNGQKINLISNDPVWHSAAQSDKHVVMSSQCCFLPIAKGKETKFNIALFNYQSKKSDPAVLVIISTSKGSSAQIIEGNEQKLLFNNNGLKADFIGQRLTDNRIERNVSIHGKMTKEEKQDNCIVIIQIPLKQKPKQVHVYHNNPYVWGGGFNTFNASYNHMTALQQQQQQQQMVSQPQANGFSFDNNMIKCANNNNNFSFGCSQPQQQQVSDDLFAGHMSAPNYKGSPKSQKADVEAAIVKVAPHTTPICSCGTALEEVQLRKCYLLGSVDSHSNRVWCDGCSKQISGSYDKLWHCPKEKSTFEHMDGYDLCLECGTKQLQFDELNGMRTIERDTRYPIRVTLQYYKSTANGVLNMDIMKAIKGLLTKSQQQADFVGSLVTDILPMRSTEADLYTKNKTEVVHHVNPWPVIAVPHVVNPFDPFGGIIINNNLNGGEYVKIGGALEGLKVKEWRQYLNNFKKEEVTDNDLENLCRDDLLELIPKMGPRNRFLKWLKQEYPNQNTDNNNFMNGFL